MGAERILLTRNVLATLLASSKSHPSFRVGLWQAGPTVNARSGNRGSSLPASVEYTAPNYAFKKYNPTSITVTAFVDEKWYQSTFKLAICTAGC